MYSSPSLVGKALGIHISPSPSPRHEKRGEGPTDLEQNRATDLKRPDPDLDT